MFQAAPLIAENATHPLIACECGGRRRVITLTEASDLLLHHADAYPTLTYQTLAVAVDHALALTHN